MANIVAVEASNMLNASLGLTTYTAATTPMKLRLITGATPGTFDSTATTAGTQTSGGSYPAGGVSLATLLTTSSAGSNVTNNAAITFSGMPATTVCGVEIWDATPTRKWFGALTANKTTNSGDTLTFATSALSIGLS